MKLEEGMVIDVILSKIFNGDMTTWSILAVVSKIQDDVIHLIPVEERGSSDYYIPDGDVLVVGGESHIKLGDWQYIEFIKPRYIVDTERIPLTSTSKEARLKELFKDISKDDIIAYLRGSNG